MSNVDRPRTGLKACPFDGATERDSNGQCHCRNVLYREVRKAPQQKAKIEKTFNGLLKDGEPIVVALNGTREAVPALVRTTKKAAAAKKAAKPKGEKASTATKPKAKKATKKAAATAEKAAEPEAEKATDKARYVLTVADWEEKPFARKDAAIKAGVRSGEDWKVVYKGKTVAASDDLL